MDSLYLLYNRLSWSTFICVQKIHDITRAATIVFSRTIPLTKKSECQVQCEAVAIVPGKLGRPKEHNMTYQHEYIYR